MPSAFVTGATGFLGTNLVRALCAAGWDVTILQRGNRLPKGLQGLALTAVSGDVTDARGLRRAMPEGPDAVFHVAASTNIWSRHNAEQTQINVEGTRNVIAAAREQGARRLVHTSSFVAYGLDQATARDDTRPAGEGSWINYVHTKAVSQRLVHEAVDDGLDAVILCPAHILGPFDYHNWSRLIVMVDRGTLPGVPPGSGPFCDVREVARAHIAAAEGGEPGAVYRLGGVQATYLDVVRQIGRILGRSTPQRTVPAWLMRAHARIGALGGAITGREPQLTPEGVALITHDLTCDSTRAERELSYRATPLETLLRDTCDWLREEALIGA